MSTDYNTLELPASLAGLVRRWREEAREVRQRYGDERSACLCEVHAQELETAGREASSEQLTLREAASVSGYSTSHLRAMIARGELRNAGRRGRPRLLRGELPRKRGHSAQLPSPAPLRRRPGPRPLAARGP